MAAAGVRLVAIETQPSVREASVVLELLREWPDLRAWLSFTTSVRYCTRTTFPYSTNMNMNMNTRHMQTLIEYSRVK